MSFGILSSYDQGFIFKHEFSLDSILCSVGRISFFLSWVSNIFPSLHLICYLSRYLFKLLHDFRARYLFTTTVPYSGHLQLFKWIASIPLYLISLLFDLLHSIVWFKTSNFCMQSFSPGKQSNNVITTLFQLLCNTKLKQRENIFYKLYVWPCISALRNSLS